jgi:heptosyltransferase-2
VIESQTKNQRSKILIMHTGGWIGDMILLTPALRALRKEFPEAHISMLVNPLVRDLMERNPYLDEVIVYDKRGAQRGIRQMREMADRFREKRFDTAIILHPNSVRSGFLAYMAGIPERIGAKLKVGQTKMSVAPFFLTTKVKRRTNIHEVQRYLDVVSSIVGANQDGKLEFWGIDRDDEHFAEHALAVWLSSLPAFPPSGFPAFSPHSGPVIGMNPCTTWPSKQWSAERFARLADLLSHRFGARVLLTGGPGDVHLGSEITRRASSQPINFIGSTTLWQLGALIKRCDLYITCDSGPMHISAAVGIPTIALFGPTDPIRHGPWGKGHIVVRKKTRCSPCYERECKSRDCMQAIQVEDVMAVVDGLLLK